MGGSGDRADHPSEAQQRQTMRASPPVTYPLWVFNRFAAQAVASIGGRQRPARATIVWR